MYKRLNLFIERLNRFKHNNIFTCCECNNECQAHDMLTDKFDKSYCEICFKQLIKSNKHLRLRSVYYPILNDEQFDKMVKDFVIINEKYKELRKDDVHLNMQFSNIIAQLLMYNKYSTYDECKQYGLFLASEEKNNYYENVYKKISVNL